MTVLWAVRAAGGGAVLLGAMAGYAAANAPVVFGTNWLAQAEHGGFCQSVADGTCVACGIDVTMQPGGPQVIRNHPIVAAF